MKAARSGFHLISFHFCHSVRTFRQRRRSVAEITLFLFHATFVCSTVKGVVFNEKHSIIYFYYTVYTHVKSLTMMKIRKCE